MSDLPRPEVVADLPRIVVAGLGPAGPDLVTEATRVAIERHTRRFLRTTRHPAASIAAGTPSFDHVYDEADTLDEVYATIVEALVGEASTAGPDRVLYLVPGSPVVAERTVELLVTDRRVAVEVLPALSFLDLTWARLGVDPVAAGVRVVDGHRFAVDAAGERGPLLVAQCDSAHVLSDVKLALDDADGLPPAEAGFSLSAAEAGFPLSAAEAGFPLSAAEAATVTVLQRLGLPDESIRTVPWTELDRIEADHLTTVWVPQLAAPVAGEVARFAELVATLRRECPWDREQTHRTLTRHLLEEAYEVLDAIDALPPDDVPVDAGVGDAGALDDVDEGAAYAHLEEELGDLLFQVVFHATLAAEEGQFTLADVARTVHDKLTLRHPHVFGEVAVSGADDVMRNWEQIKKVEKGRDSVFDGMPSQLPALLYALKVQKKAAGLADAGLAVPAVPAVADVVDAAGATPDAATVGTLLFATVELARRQGVDPEAALRAVATHHRERSAEAESGAGARGPDGPVTPWQHQRQE